MNDWAPSLHEIEPKERLWLWRNYIPLGEITLIAGIQGIGKSILTTDMVARITTGRKWPDNTPCPDGSVILLAAEDNIANTVRPRYDAARADLERIIVVKGAPSKREGKLIPFSIGRDVMKIAYLLERMELPRAIFIDPLGSYVGNIDTNRENEVRNIMYALRTEIAEKFNVAVVGVVHLRKGGDDSSALSRVLGSVAFTGAARTVWGVAQDTDDPSRRLFVPMKHNLVARSVIGYEFYVVTGINGQGVIRWGDKVMEIADEVMVDRGMKPEQKREKAQRIILEMLAEGPRKAVEIQERILEEDISERTMKSAKKSLGIRSVKSGNEWVWLPPKNMKKRRRT